MSISFDYLLVSDDAVRVSRSDGFQRDHSYQDGAKRVLDLTLILIFAPLILATIGVLALCVAAGGQQPFYLQKRLGRHGRVFTMVKLCTMVPNADAALRAYLAKDPLAAREWRQSQKLAKDPRVTAFGRFLRRSSLDELPQLWNVFTGEMSLVGPRPMMPDQEPLYPGRAYFRMRPGITGPWQVSKRNMAEFAARARFDTIYELRQSVWTDVGLIWRTLGVVWRQTGC